MRNIEQNERFKVAAYEQFKRLQKKPIRYWRAVPKMRRAQPKGLSIPGCRSTSSFRFAGNNVRYGYRQYDSHNGLYLCPIAADRVVMESSLQFASMVNDHLISSGKANIKGLYLLWNMVDGRERTDLYRIYEKVAAEMGVPILKPYFPTVNASAGRRWKKAIKPFSVPLFSTGKALIKGSNLDALSDEILTIIKQ